MASDSFRKNAPAELRKWRRRLQATEILYGVSFVAAFLLGSIGT